MMKSLLAILFFDINAKQKPSMDHARKATTQETEIGRLKLETTLGKLVRPCLKEREQDKIEG